MAATYPSAYPGSWRSVSRTLGAVFTGSAMMFVVAALHEGSVRTAVDDTARSVAEPSPAGTGTTSNPSSDLLPGAPASPAPAPDRAAPGTAEATAEERTPLGDLAVRQAPQQDAATAADEGAADEGAGSSNSGHVGDPTPRERPTRPAEEDDGVLTEVKDYLGLGF